MKKLLTFLFCAIALSSVAQSSSYKKFVNAPATIEPAKHKQSMVYFPGGKEAFQTFLSENLEQPDNIEFGEKVTMNYLFLVEANGYIDKIIGLPAGTQFKEEVLDIMNKYSYWDPTEEGQPDMPVYFNIAVSFIGE